MLDNFLASSKFDFISLRACYSRFFDSWRAILRIALPATGTNLIAPLSVAITTWFVAKYSPEAVAGFGVASRIESLFLVVIMGLSSIMGPFVGQNWGAKNYQRGFAGLDIRLKFNTSEGTYDENTSVIAVITEDKRMVGIVVDKVDDVQRLDTSTLAPVSEMGSAIPSKYLKGYVRLDNNEMLVIMDIERVVDKEELKD